MDFVVDNHNLDYIVVEVVDNYTKITYIIKIFKRYKKNMTIPLVYVNLDIKIQKKIERNERELNLCTETKV